MAELHRSDTHTIDCDAAFVLWCSEGVGTAVMTVPGGRQAPLSVLVTILLYRSTLQVVVCDEVKKFCQ